MQKELLWQSDMENGHFKNPILFADYSDPDVVRVEDTFYMTASSFNYTPGLPVLVSKDLVNWELKNYAIKNIDYPRYDVPAHAKGVWAPAIRYHDNKFWIFYGMPDEGIFYVTAEDALGDWSEPYLLLEGKGYIDPCPFWDEDDRAYVIHGYAKSRIGFKSILGIFEMSPDCKKVLDDDRFIFDGTVTQPTIEGPKVYKRDGWYYIFAPAGGVKPGWQTVLRSKNIEGPYEEKIVLAQKDTVINGPHQGALVDTLAGEEWFIHFQDRGLYGRIEHLQPVVWKDAWPIIGVDPDEDGCGKPCLIHPVPKGMLNVQPTYLEASDDFMSDSLGLQWQWLGNHKDNFCQMVPETGLKLNSLNTGDPTTRSLWHSSNVLTQKLVCPAFRAQVTLSVAYLQNNEQAGFVMFGGQYAYVAVRKEHGKRSLVYVESFGEDETKEENTKVIVPWGHSADEITIQMQLNNDGEKVTMKMAYCLSDGEFVEIGDEYEPIDHQWVGSKIGIFSVALDQSCDHGYAVFKNFQVEGLPTPVKH